MLETIGAIGGALAGAGQAASGIAGLFGGGGGGGTNWTQLAIMREQAQLQREFAQQGIQWRVADAKAAGIHPLYALGGAGASYSPSAVSIGTGGGSDIGADLARVGSGVSRAVAAVSSKEDRSDAAYQSQMRIMGLDRANLENRLLETQIAASQAALMRSQVGPPMPTGAGTSAVSGVNGVYDAKPPEVHNVNPLRPGNQAGPAQPGGRSVVMNPGGNVVANLPSTDMNFEEVTTPGTASWHYWNSVMPFLSSDARNAQRPPSNMLPKGASHWRWTPFGYVAQYPRVPGRDIANSALYHRRVNNRPNYGPRASTYRFAPSGAER